MLCREMPDELTSQQASVIRSFSASSTFFRMEPWTRRASNMAAVEMEAGGAEEMLLCALLRQGWRRTDESSCCWRAADTTLSARRRV